ncbi:MAG: ABC transporter permease [Acidimicrobiales bacterium]|nr:ABC transporter permease [Acidimicrobiales bacterium]
MFLATRELRRGAKRYSLLSVVIALVAVLSTILSGLATGLVTDGISGLRALPIDHLAFEPGAEATFSRSTITPEQLATFQAEDAIEATPLGMSFANARPAAGGPNLDMALFGIAPDSFLLPNKDARSAISGKPGLVLSHEFEEQGVNVGDLYKLGSSDLELPVVGFTFGGTYGHAPIGFTSLSTWRELTFGNPDDSRSSAIGIRVQSGANVDLGALDETANTDTITKQAAYAGSPGFTAETTTMSLIRSFLLVISALVIGAFFTVLTVQRTRQIGLLKAMGASNGYIARDGVGQMAILVSAATIAGTLVGAGLVALVGRGDAPVELSPSSIITSGLSLIVAGVIGSLVALRRITQVEPAIALGAE